MTSERKALSLEEMLETVNTFIDGDNVRTVGELQLVLFSMLMCYQKFEAQLDYCLNTLKKLKDDNRDFRKFILTSNKRETASYQFRARMLETNKAIMKRLDEIMISQPSGEMIVMKEPIDTHRDNQRKGIT